MNYFTDEQIWLLIKFGLIGLIIPLLFLAILWLERRGKNGEG